MMPDVPFKYMLDILFTQNSTHSSRSSSQILLSDMMLTQVELSLQELVKFLVSNYEEAKKNHYHTSSCPLYREQNIKKCSKIKFAQKDLKGKG